MHFGGRGIFLFLVVASNARTSYAQDFLTDTELPCPSLYAADAVAKFPVFPVDNNANRGIFHAVERAAIAESNFQFSLPHKSSYVPGAFEEITLIRDKAVAEAVPLLLKEFSKDSALSSFTDEQLRRASRRVLRWHLRISNEAGLEMPGWNMHAAFEVERYRLHLQLKGLNPHGRPESYSSLLSKFGFPRLSHATTVENFIDVLKAGKIMPRLDSNQRAIFDAGKSEYVYLEGYTGDLVKGVRHPSTGETHRIYIELDNSVLDKVRWSHVNSFWMFGDKDASHSFGPNNMLAAYLNLIKQIAGGGYVA